MNPSAESLGSRCGDCYLRSMYTAELGYHDRLLLDGTFFLKLSEFPHVTRVTLYNRVPTNFRVRPYLKQDTEQALPLLFVMLFFPPPKQVCGKRPGAISCAVRRTPFFPNESVGWNLFLLFELLVLLLLVLLFLLLLLFP